MDANRSFSKNIRQIYNFYGIISTKNINILKVKEILNDIYIL